MRIKKIGHVPYKDFRPGRDQKVAIQGNSIMQVNYPTIPPKENQLLCFKNEMATGSGADTPHSESLEPPETHLRGVTFRFFQRQH